MRDARSRGDWDRMSMLIAKLHNVNVAKRGDCIKFTDIHPFYTKSQDTSRDPTQEEIQELRKAFR